MSGTEVLIIGAGPTGLVLALWLSKLGVSVRIIDKASGPGTTSRALAVQARTLELYNQLDLATTVVERGHQVPAANLWVKGQQAAHLSLEQIGSGQTPYPFIEIFPQDEHERLLIERLQAFDVQVQWQTELLELNQGDQQVNARLRLADGSEQDCSAVYLAGCDGARSAVRKALGIGSPVAPTSRCSSSPTCRHQARQSMANCTSTSTKRTFSPCSPSPAAAVYA